MLSHNNPARVNPWYGFYLFLLFFTQWGKPSVAFQNSEKRALWSMDGSSCISKLWFWLIKNATVHMGLCFLLRRETNRFLCVGGELQIPPPLLQPHWATSLPLKHTRRFPNSCLRWHFFLTLTPMRSQVLAQMTPPVLIPSAPQSRFTCSLYSDLLPLTFFSDNNSVEKLEIQRSIKENLNYKI